jgi:hypothetical protein
MSSEKRASTWQTVLWIFVILAAIGGITYAAIRFRPNGETTWNGGGGDPEGRFCASTCKDCPVDVPLPSSTPLPIPKLTRDTSPWFISTDIEKTPRISIIEDFTNNVSGSGGGGGSVSSAALSSGDSSNNNDALRVDYVPFKWSTDSGAEFKANPIIETTNPSQPETLSTAPGAPPPAVVNSLPSSSAVLRYSVYFPPDFPWTKGGKLPGFCISNTTNGCATGSRWSNSSGSVRIMFRQEGRGIGYVYVPLQVAGAQPGHAGIAEVNAVQGPEFQTVSNLPTYSTTGIDLWCKASGGLQFIAGVWNNVTMVVRMNDVGLQNGGLSLTVNSDTREINDILWRIDNNVQINQFLFATFFGGSDSGWMITQPTFSLFKNFEFAAPAPEVVFDSPIPVPPPTS